MKPDTPEILKPIIDTSTSLEERVLLALQLCRSSIMSVQFFRESNSIDSIEAVTGTLRCQEAILENVFGDVEEMCFVAAKLDSSSAKP